MDKKELGELIKTLEGYTLEFKEILNRSIAKDMCAFANASGSKIILGVKDRSKIIGYTLTNRDSSRIQDLARNMEPTFSVNVEPVGKLAVIYVPEGKNKPYLANGHFYLRIGASSQRLSRDEIREFFQRENQIFFDRKTSQDFNLKVDFDEDAFEAFLKRANIPKDIPRKAILRNLNLLTGDHINNAGVLFFCHDITRFFMNATVVCVLYEGTERVDIIDRKEFVRDFLSNFNDTYTYVRSKLNTNFIIQGKDRINRLELPKEALREAIINAMVHRDYFSLGQTQIDIFLDRVEISNPGNLLFDEKELGEISIARNPILMDMMFRADYVEKIGSGIKRMKRMVAEYGLKIDFKITSDWFRTIFYRKTAQKEDGKSEVGLVDGLVERWSEKWSERWSEGWSKKWSELNERQRVIIALIAEKPTISRKELSNIIGINQSAIQKHIETLKKKGMIRRIGPDKGGRWEIVE